MLKYAVRRALGLTRFSRIQSTVPLHAARQLASTTLPSRRTCGIGSLRCVPPRAAGAPVSSTSVVIR
eukprot:scaffold94700_cov65-Phaeocystis_antarctica.AAC.11